MASFRSDGIADRIKELLTMEDVLRHYGYPVSRYGRIPCPLHNGHDRNFSFKQGHFKCFVCGKSGSVIDFVMHLYGITFSQAVMRINADFGLGLTSERPSPTQRAEALERRLKSQRQDEERRAEYYDKAREHRYWHEAQKHFAPSREGWEAGVIHPLYLEAVRRLPELEWWLNEHLMEKEG